MQNVKYTTCLNRSSAASKIVREDNFKRFIHFMWQLQDSISLNCFESIMDIGESGALRTRLRLRGNSFFAPSFKLKIPTLPLFRLTEGVSQHH